MIVEDNQMSVTGKMKIKLDTVMVFDGGTKGTHRIFRYAFLGTVVSTMCKHSLMIFLHLPAHRAPWKNGETIEKNK